MGKNINIHLTEEDILMVNKCMRECLPSLTIIKVKINTATRFKYNIYQINQNEI